MCQPANSAGLLHQPITMNQLKYLSVIAAVTASLAACGGGGGSDGGQSADIESVSSQSLAVTEDTVATNARMRQGSTMATSTAVSPDMRLMAAKTSMSLPNEVIPFGVLDSHDWKHRPTVTLGTLPLGTNLPSWWPGIRLAEWRGFTPWFVVFETGQGNRAPNTLVEVSGIEAWALRESTGRWELLASGNTPLWYELYVSESVTQRSNARPAGRVRNGVAELDAGGGYAVHGGLQIVPTPWHSKGPDILAIYVSLKHRLVLRDETGPDDRELASLGVQAGADYWPCETKCDTDIQSPYYPASGTGRIMRSKLAYTRSTFYAERTTGATESAPTIPPLFIYD